MDIIKQTQFFDCLFDYSKAHKSERLCLISPSLENFKMATPVRNHPIMLCITLRIEYIMYVYVLCLFYLILRLNIYI